MIIAGPTRSSEPWARAEMGEIYRASDARWSARLPSRFWPRPVRELSSAFDSVLENSSGAVRLRAASCRQKNSHLADDEQNRKEPNYFSFADQLGTTLFVDTSAFLRDLSSWSTAGLTVIRSDVRGFPPPCPPTSSQKYSIAPLHSAESSHPNTPDGLGGSTRNTLRLVRVKDASGPRKG